MRKIVMLISLLAFSSGAGCASKNYTTTLSHAPRHPGDVPAKFRIGHVDPIPGSIFYMSGYTDDEYWAKTIPDAAKTGEFPGQLKQLLTCRHPELFSDSPDALRVDIRFRITGLEGSSTASSFLAAVSWGIFGIILPLPITMHYDCALDIRFPDLETGQTSQFRNRLVTWISFPSPLALIPVPAPADRRGSVLHPLQSKYYSGRLFTLECFGEAVVNAIESIDTNRLAAAARKLRG